MRLELGEAWNVMRYMTVGSVPQRRGEAQSHRWMTACMEMLDQARPWGLGCTLC